MKKLISIVLSITLMATMFCGFTLVANAADFREDYDVEENGFVYQLVKDGDITVGVQIVGYTRNDREVVIPDTVNCTYKDWNETLYDEEEKTNDLPVLKICWYAFEGKAMTTVRVPSTLKEIEQGAFNGCIALKTFTVNTSTATDVVAIPESVTTIGDYAFAGCKSIHNVVWPGAANSIPNGCFQDCLTLKSVDLSKNNVTTIRDYAFSGCSVLKTMTLPNQLTTMGEGVFSHCTALESMVLPNSLYTLAWGTFYDCTNLQEVQLANEISQIPDGTFWNCRKLRKVSLSKEIALIGDYIFDSCESLHTVNYGGTMEEWRDIPKGSFNEYLNKAVMIRCTDGTIYRDLAAPLQVKATLYGYNDVKASWSKVDGADGYFVYYKKSTASTYTLLGKTTSLSYKKANLSDGGKYTFRVYPYIKDGDTYIKDSSYKTSSSIYTLKKVSGVKAARNGSKVKVSWTNINGESGYQISKSTKKTGTSIVKTYSTTSGKYYNVSATKGKTYYYKVRAYKTVNGTKIYGPWSSVVKYKRTR